MSKKSNDQSISLNKFIRDSGLCSRREADDFIAQERVTINGKIAQQGNRVTQGDEVKVDGERIKSKKNKILIALHKPANRIVKDPHGKADDLAKEIGYGEALYAIDPLDKDMEGLVLLTNDGALASELNQSSKITNEYAVFTARPVSDEDVQKVKDGIRVLGYVLRPKEIKKSGPTKLKIELSQGKSKFLRPMCLSIGNRLKKLQRIRIGSVMLKDMPVGQWRVLLPDEIMSIIAGDNAIKKEPRKKVKTKNAPDSQRKKTLSSSKSRSNKSYKQYRSKKR